jgi:aquaporin Z
MARALDIGEVPGLLEAIIAGLDPVAQVETRAPASSQAATRRRPVSEARGPAVGPADALRRHWPEYLMEAWGLGMFMVSAGLFATLLWYPGSPAAQAVPDGLLRRALMGLAMGLTAIGIIYSPFGQRSGAHINPAVTLTFWRLGKVATWDAVFYVGAQFLGGLLGVWLVVAVFGLAFANPPVSYVATVPGAEGVWVALLAEALISFGLMSVVLFATNTPRLMRLTGVFAGVLVALYITLEAPVSGMSMNPARTVASALPGHLWTGLWIYFIGPTLGMLLAVPVYRAIRRTPGVICAKLNHHTHHRCIFHCGYGANAGHRR